MIPTRAVLALPAAALVLSGCGAVSAVTLRTTTESVAYADTTQHLPRPRDRRRRHNRPCARAPPRRSPVAPTDLVVTVPATGDQRVARDPDRLRHRRRRRHDRSAAEPWLTAAGAGRRLLDPGRRGARAHACAARCARSVPVPSDANGVVIGPDGTSYAYATSDTASERHGVEQDRRGPARCARRRSSPTASRTRIIRRPTRRRAGTTT